MTAEIHDKELREQLAEKVRGLKLEYYDLLHRHGFADFKLDEEAPDGYESDEIWLTGVYVDSLEELIQDRDRQARIDEVERFAEVPFVKVQKYYIDRIATLANQKPNKEEK